MPIGNAVQKGDWIYVYDPKGHQLASVACNSKKGDGLKGYTAETFSVQKDGWIYTYDEKGHQLNSMRG